jgi:cytidine deaminase
MVDKNILFAEAEAALENAYAPYSGFKVGAALLSEDGTIITGANVENINHTNTGHAETVAFNKAITEGHDTFAALGVVCSEEPTAPCGMCRQTIAEFCDEDFPIYVAGLGKYTLGELLPEPMEEI